MSIIEAMKTAHCSVCDKEGHYPAFCYMRTKKPIKTTKKLRQVGKYLIKWKVARRQWFKENPAHFYTCYICSKVMSKDETTLDHILPRSNRPDLRYVMSNLAPCCLTCNLKKGSKH